MPVGYAVLLRRAHPAVLAEHTSDRLAASTRFLWADYNAADSFYWELLETARLMAA